MIATVMSALCAIALGGLAVVTLAPANGAAACTDVHIVFARATGEPAGLGILGRPFAQGVARGLPGRSVSVYAVRYNADFSQRFAGQGAADLVQHVKSVAARCPSTRFVLGGYSQGASVIGIALGIGGPLGTGPRLPDSFASKVAAIAVFGNPGRTYAGGPITARSRAFGRKAIDLCNPWDVICTGRGWIGPHLQYQGLSVSQAVAFAVSRVKSGTSGG